MASRHTRRRRQIVFVVSICEGWARVDIEGDGRTDGFASAGLLERRSDSWLLKHSLDS
jgi:hypothetical protein